MCSLTRHLQAEGKSPKKSLFSKTPVAAGRDDKTRIIYQLKAAADARVESMELAYKERIAKDIAEHALLEQQAKESLAKLRALQRKASLDPWNTSSSQQAALEIQVPGHGPVRISLACDSGLRIVPSVPAP